MLKQYCKSFQEGNNMSKNMGKQCNPNIFSEIIELQENGGSGGNQTQIPYFQFYMGIAA